METAKFILSNYGGALKYVTKGSHDDADFQSYTIWNQ